MLKYNVINVDSNIDQKLSFYLKNNGDTETALIYGITNLMDFYSDFGTSFDALTYLAINYFYDNVYVYYTRDDDKLIKNRFRKVGGTTIAGLKAILDACNHTSYTPIQTLNTAEYRELFCATYYAECYLIIQTAYFFGSQRFEQHPYIKVVENYRKTGIVLQNDLEKERLESAFNKIDQFKEWQKYPKKFKKKPIPFGKDNYMNSWYYGVLDIIANTFGTCKNFKYEFPLKNGKISEYRCYNKLIQTPRILRKVQPFEMVEFDIKSGHLSYIDLLIGSNVSKTAYENYAKTYSVSRDEAKRKFQSILNMREYRTTYIKRMEYLNTLCGFGWTIEQAKRIFSEITDSNDHLFGHWATKHEYKFVNNFAVINMLYGWTRGHDALYCIKRRDVDYSGFITSLENGVIQFELEIAELHHNNYEIKQYKYKKQKAIYFGGLKIVGVVVKLILGKIPPIVMSFKDCVTVTWRKDDPEKKQVFSVLVNLNYHQDRFEYYSPKIDCKKNIYNEIINAYKTFFVLNNYNISPAVTYLFCQHIRKFLMLDVVAFSRLLLNECGSDHDPKIRNTRISLNYDNNKSDDYDNYEDEDSDAEQFNNMVAINIVEGICSKVYKIMELQIFLKEWIVGNDTIRTKPKKHTDTKDLLTKMYEIDSIGKRANLKETAIRADKLTSIVNEYILNDDLYDKIAFGTESGKIVIQENFKNETFCTDTPQGIMNQYIAPIDLFSKTTFCLDVDNIEISADLLESAILPNKSISIIKESIICGDLFGKMVFCPKIDRKRTKIRQQAQLKKQEKDWHNEDEKRTRQMTLAKEIAFQIDNWINYKPKYNIEYVTKYN